MSTPTSWSDLRGRSVVVWGVGVEGAANLRRLHEVGVSPSAVVDQHAGRLEEGHDVLSVESRGGLAALHNADVIVKSPGISRYDPLVQELVASGIHVLGGMGLWLAEAPRERVVCITGTKGKSTTTAIVGTLLRGMGVRCFIGGNLGSPPWNPDVPRDVDYWVIEVSSYQALDVVVGPAIVVVTSLSEDHLTWHRSDPEQYYSDKLSLCTKPGVRTVIANGADKTLRARASMLGQAVSWVDDLPGAWAENLGLRGLHNLRNAEIARIAVLELGIEGAADATVLGQAASNYEPLPSRLSWIGNVAGVDFIDDSLSTNVLPTLAALEAFNGRRIALLVGGHERGIDYAPLAEALALRNPDVLVVTMPDNGPRIATAVKSVHGAPDVIECDNIQAATATAFEWARPDGVVLLSPAAPSFGRHTNYQGRAAAFLAAMRALVIDGEN